MLIGVLSDTHDRVQPAKLGIATLRAAGAEYYIHCGDVGGERIFDLMAGLPCTFVFGNNDFDRAGLARYAQDLGIQCGDKFAELELDRTKVAVTHGDDLRLVRNATREGSPYRYLFVGHTHLPSDDQAGSVRMINPGALYRATRKTVAIVDTRADSVRFLTVNV
jgi:putative phosphoesterase